MTNVVKLGGCHPEPLAHYLKALGILRLVSEQSDPDARGRWEGESFILETRLSDTELRDFFLATYRPTPVTAPWNAGSGFYYQEEKLNQKDPTTGKKIKTGNRNQPTAATKVVDRLLASTTERFSLFRKCLATAKEIVAQEKIMKAPADEDKGRLIQIVRNVMPDEALPWLDAVVVMTGDKTKYPPLLGTGGNDGNTDFTSNFMQRLLDLINEETGGPTNASGSYVDQSLFESTVSGLQKKSAIGQFYPSAAGGANATVGFSSDSLINPWDFVLMIEGALVFAAASVKRLESAIPGALAYPFCVRQVGAGYGSASGADESARAEMWMPLWEQSSSYREIQQLLMEGRAQVGKRAAKNGADFARAVASLGVDRGISAFVRYGFQERNGLAYFATPLGRWRVELQSQVGLLDELDEWLDRFRRAGGDKEAPARLGRVVHDLETAIFDLCRLGDARRLQSMLIALGRSESVLAKLPKFRKDKFLSPLQFLRPAWVDQADDASSEFAIAASLASIAHPKLGAIRRNLEPVEIGKERVWWGEIDNSPGVVWDERDLSRNLAAVLARRCMDAQRAGINGLPITGTCPLASGHVAAYVNGEVDEERIKDLFWGLMLVDWRQVGRQEMKESEPKDEIPSAIYALLKLCFLPDQGRRLLRRAEGPPPVPYEAEILRRLEAGDLKGAVARAARRLSASGIPPRFQIATGNVEMARRLAGSLLFPISPNDERMLAQQVVAVKSISELAV